MNRPADVLGAVVDHAVQVQSAHCPVCLVLIGNEDLRRRAYGGLDEVQYTLAGEIAGDLCNHVSIAFNRADNGRFL